MRIPFSSTGCRSTITIAFKRYTPLDGFFGGEWIGLKYINDFLADPFLWRLVRNTLLLGALAFGFPAPIIFARC